MSGQNRGVEVGVARAGSPALFEAVFANALDAVLLADDEGAYIDVNPATCELTGYSREELLDMTIADISVEPSAFPEAWARFRAAGRAEGRFTVRRRDGTSVESDFRAVADVAPGVHLSVMHDITAQVEAERAAADREARLDLVLDQLPAALWTTDTDLRFTMLKGARGRVVQARISARGGRGAEFIGAHIEGPDVGVLVDAHRRALMGEEVQYEAQVDNTVWRSHVEPLRDERGDIVGVVGVGIDITESQRMRRELEATVETLRVLENQRRNLIEELLRARDDERRRLSRDLHDDLGQTLTSLKLIAAALDRGPDEELRDGLADVCMLAQKASEATRHLVGQLREEPLEDPTLRVSLQRLAADTESIHGIPVDVSVSAGDGLVPVEVATAVHRVASEAVNNAVKHSEPNAISVVAVRRGDSLAVVVEDDGRGFELDRAAQARGHGLLGMRERVAELGGTLTIDTGPGRGTIVRAELPLEA